MSMIRAIRGATTAAMNTKEEIFSASQEMIEKIIADNDIDVSDISDIIFTVTPDITAAFPAAAVRRMGIADVPLLDMAAPNINDALKMCIRVMVHINTDKSNSELHHVYLRGAKVLRPDIGSKGKISVAIDGPAGAGKSSVAKKLAERLGYIYIDTGAMYRTVGVYGIEKGIDIANEKDRLISELDNIKIEINYENGIQRMYLNGSDVTGRIRENDASMAASAVAVIPEIRERLVAMQQEMAKTGGVIMDGRDIGTKVLPNAELKIYLTASVENRAMRRYKEYVEKGEECDFEAIKADVIKRDYNDTHRAASPLVQADDAILVDTSDMNFEESVAAIEKMIKNTEVH